MEFIKEFLYPVLDILIVAYIIYTLYKLIAGTRTIQVLRGILILVVAYFIGQFLELKTFLWLFKQGLSFAAIALIVIFQHELRRIVMKLGENTPIFGNLFKQREEELMSLVLPAVFNMSKTKTGALIVITKNTGLRGIIERGVKLDAIITSELLEAIFVPKNPLHDGATIIVEDRIAAAACLLPLTERTDLSKIFGTRHRAAIGLSEETDSVIIAVSEETGKVSLAFESKLYYDLKQEKFETYLSRFLFTPSKEELDEQDSFNFGEFINKAKNKLSTYKILGQAKDKSQIKNETKKKKDQGENTFDSTKEKELTKTGKGIDNV